MSFCLGNIIGPLSFTPASAPDYIPAKITIGKFQGDHISSKPDAATLDPSSCANDEMFPKIIFYYIRENKRRDGLKAAGDLGHIHDIEFSDRTDRENKEFRYRL
ncbi:hypothetical protein LTR97_002361 [Elasticomyces elasticus]|uniref:Uncharacterized protein n=1 Tax=Elasticomyces elasticus TaxID=574655 RepID=A0AAN7WBF4_9PEZI|nr:hypothetical protein LTR97_002361 [Elasticomyces elasticus]